MRALVVVAVAALLAGPASAAGLTVTGRDGKAAPVTAEAFAALPHVKVHVNQHGQAHDFEGVPVSALLGKVGVSVDKPLGGRDLSGAIRVTAADGYQVVLALSEIDPATRKGAVIVADRDGGKPLDAANGPYRLVVEDDLRPARSARQVERIEVLDLSTSTKKAGR